MDVLKPGLDAKKLKEDDIDRAAREFNLSKTEILTRCLEAKGINYQQQESEAIRAAQLDRSDYNRGQILWQILERSMNTSPKRSASPEPAVKRAAPKAPIEPTGRTLGKTNARQTRTFACILFHRSAASPGRGLTVLRLHLLPGKSGNRRI